MMKTVSANVDLTMCPSSFQEILSTGLFNENDPVLLIFNDEMMKLRYIEFTLLVQGHTAK